MKRLAILAPMLIAALAIPAVGRAADGEKSGIDRAHFDPRVRVQDDLYRHVNGAWLESAEIPADRSIDGAFMKLRDKSEADIRAIIEAQATRAGVPEGSISKKVGDLFASFMDEARIEELGARPIAEDLARVDAIADKAALIRLLGQVQRGGTDGPFGLGVDTDARKSDRYIVILDQGGLGLPDESYYREEKHKGIRDAYVVHLRKMLELAGLPDPGPTADRVFALETRLARGHWDRVKNRDDILTYNKKDRPGLDQLTPGFDWDSFLAGFGARGIEEVIVRQPSYFTAMARAIDEVPIADWKSWLKWSVIRNNATLLSKPFVEEQFAFYGRKLTGAPELRPRWKRGVAAVENVLGQALGKLYVEEHFPPAAKEKMKLLVANLIEAYRRDIGSLDWMSAETKTKALEKLSKFNPKIGYPDNWRDYSALEIRRNDLVGNLKRGAEFEVNRALAKLGKPVDRTEWLMTPQTVNAYYNPGMNEIVFPAAILQPPFFDLAADDAVNYGGIVAVIGHEVGHGFDDQGSKYDGDGNLNDWWTPSDRSEFEARARKLIEQYNGFSPAQTPGQHVNGALTIGENIGDLGGLTLAYKAYKISLDGKPSAVIDGLTGEQRFFTGWAQVWRAKYRDPELLRRLTVDPHSPSEFRCNGIVRNMPEFYEAFGVKPGDKLWLPEADRVKIW